MLCCNFLGLFALTSHPSAADQEVTLCLQLVSPCEDEAELTYTLTPILTKSRKQKRQGAAACAAAQLGDIREKRSASCCTEAFSAAAAQKNVISLIFFALLFHRQGVQRSSITASRGGIQPGVRFSASSLSRAANVASALHDHSYRVLLGSAFPDCAITRLTTRWQLLMSRISLRCRRLLPACWC